jgi:uncharacterized membrane protein
VPVGWAALGTAMAARAPSRKRAVAWVVGSFLAWLAFYPNAPYIFTDFIHVIRRGNLGVPAVKWMSELDLLWFDIIMNAAFAFVGHYLGLLSMYIMHRLLTEQLRQDRRMVAPGAGHTAVGLRHTSGPLLAL